MMHSNYRMNSKMLPIYDEMNRRDLSSVILSPELNVIIHAGIIRDESAVLLSHLMKLAQSTGKNEFQDLTGFECFVNHFHLDEYPSYQDDVTRLKIALLLIDEITSLLNAKKLSGEYNHIISMDDTSCTLRFHKIRVNESWLMDNLEDYKDDAILVAKTNV